MILQHLAQAIFKCKANISNELWNVYTKLIWMNSSLAVGFETVQKHLATGAPWPLEQHKVVKQCIFYNSDAAS